jgi:hypothetical protein
VKRLWSRMGVRAASVGLLVLGLTGGVYLGQNRDVQRQSVEAQLVVQANEDEMRLLKERQADASKARTLEKEVIEAKEAEKVKKAEEAGGPVPFTGDIPASCDEYKGSRKIGCALMLDKGYALDQFPCLENLWDKESGWNYKALNSSSGAYGIPQSLPGDKMASAGSDWKTNPATQIKWGLGYIKGRYGTPCKAWGHSQNVGWY